MFNKPDGTPKHLFPPEVVLLAAYLVWPLCREEVKPAGVKPSREPTVL